MSNSDILREFLLETHENLTLLDGDLISLEMNPAEKSTLAQVFRTFHSVKGTAGFMGLEKLQAVAHSAESLLSKLRSGDLRYSPPIATALLGVVDAIREMLRFVEADGSEGPSDYSALVAELNQLRDVASKAEEIAPEPRPHRAIDSSPTPSKPLGLSPTPPAAKVSGSQTAESAFAPPTSDTTLLFPPPEPREEPKSVPVADSNIRVDVSLLDKLMMLVSELVLSRNQILQHSVSQEDDRFLGAVQRLNLLTTELQASVMKTRMQPIGNVLNKFPRVVRDLAIACGKKVEFVMEGQDTELDKTLIEAIRDPLTHMVRNAIDHGIELPELRKARGKRETGLLRMVAFHESGKVIVEITDDGGGIDADRVRDRAISARLVTPEAAARFSHQDLLRLIFLPGFSTVDKVTQFSGRGVGMDVVRTNIERIGGAIDIKSAPDQGTTIRTIIPLTLAIIPALIIVSGGERYAIPQVSLLEVVRVEEGLAQRGVEHIHGAPVFRLRGDLLPLVFLNEQLELAADQKSENDVNIIVLQVDDRMFGLVVDGIRDTEEIVVKPLQKQLKGVSVFAGAAIMGDGRVALVLDILGLAQRAKVISGAKSRAFTDQKRIAASAHAKAQAILLFCPTAGGRMSIPLSLVSRLEELPRSTIEKLGSNQVVRYRDEILPLINVSAALDALSPGEAGNDRRSDGIADVIPIIVCTLESQRIGLVVERIVDIVHDEITERSRSSRRGVLFTAIIQEKVTEFLDLGALVGGRSIESLASTS